MNTISLMKKENCFFRVKQPEQKERIAGENWIIVEVYERVIDDKYPRTFQRLGDTSMLEDIVTNLKSTEAVFERPIIMY